MKLLWTYLLVRLISPRNALDCGKIKMDGSSARSQPSKKGKPLSELENPLEGEAEDGRFWKIYNGQALEALKELEPDSVDCIVTSPPYFWLRDYGVQGQLGMEETVKEYINNISDVMSEAKRVLKPTGTAFFNVGDTYYSGKGKSHGKDSKSAKRRFGLRAVDKSGGLDIGISRKSLIGIPWRLMNEFSTRGWVVRSAIIWNRKSRLPEHVTDRPGRSYEYVFMLAKDRKYYFDRDALMGNDEDIWEIAARPRHSKGISTAPFPDELVERCLALGCPPGGVVLDPFVGSGTTVRASLRSGRSAIGIDLNKEFCIHAAAEARQACT